MYSNQLTLDLINHVKFNSSPAIFLATVAITKQCIMIRVDGCHIGYWYEFDDIIRCSELSRRIKFLVGERTLRRRYKVNMDTIRQAIDENKLKVVISDDEVLFSLESAIAFVHELRAKRGGA